MRIFANGNDSYIESKIGSAQHSSRRAFIGTAVAFGAWPALGAQQTAKHGVVRPPLDLPEVHLVLADGRSSALRTVLQGKSTALQLMFTECRMTCPMEGAVFQRVQTLLPDHVKNDLQLFSLSVSPQGEEPGALSAWLRSFHAGQGWMAGFPTHADLPTIRSLFGQGRSERDPHTTQVQMFNHDAQLVWRSSELPSAEEVAYLLTNVSKTGGH